MNEINDIVQSVETTKNAVVFVTKHYVQILIGLFLVVVLASYIGSKLSTKF